MNAIHKLAAALELASTESSNTNYVKQLLVLASDTLIKQQELLIEAGAMMDKHIASLNMIVDNTIKTIH